MTVRVRIEPMRRGALRWIADLLMVAGLAGVAVWLWALTDGALYQYVQGERFATNVGAGTDPEAAAGEAAGDPPRPEVFPPALPSLATLWKRDPRVMGRLEIPSVGLSVMVREGVDESTLRKAAGHLPSSAAPGQAGNFVLLGHRDTFFRPLREIALGDAVHVETPRGRFTYIVEAVTVRSPDAVPVHAGGSAAISTLITCYPFSLAGPAPRRWVVQARIVEPAAELDQAVQ